MGSNNIYLLTGKVNSGKTTILSEWIQRKKNCGGILQPKINGKRFLLNIRTGEEKSLEVINGISSVNVVRVGKYSFNIATLDWAKNILMNEINNSPDWLIIDEYGKLELEDKGLEPVVSQIIERSSNEKTPKILIVIRDYLVTDFLGKFSFGHNSVNILTTEELDSI